MSISILRNGTPQPFKKEDIEMACAKRHFHLFLKTGNAPIATIMRMEKG